MSTDKSCDGDEIASRNAVNNGVTKGITSPSSVSQGHRGSSDVEYVFSHDIDVCSLMEVGENTVLHVSPDTTDTVYPEDSTIDYSLSSPYGGCHDNHVHYNPGGISENICDVVHWGDGIDPTVCDAMYVCDKDATPRELGSQGVVGHNNTTPLPSLSNSREAAGCDECKGTEPSCMGAGWLCIKKAGQEDYPVCVHATNTISLKSQDARFSVYKQCLEGTCTCAHFIEGANTNMKPCRTFAECFCRGSIDEDWGYMMQGAIFGFKVVNNDCETTYLKENYKSVLEPGVREKMQEKITSEIGAGIVTIVDTPPKCVHAYGAVEKEGGGIRAIVDCSAPGSDCINNYTDQVGVKFSYNSVDTVTEMLVQNDKMCTVDISDAYRAVNTDVDSRQFQGLSWDMDGDRIYMTDNRLSMGLSSSPFVFSKISNFIVRCAGRRGCRRIVNYLDDYCVINTTLEECREDQRRLLEVLRHLGFYISYKKLSHQSTKTRFLGILVDSETMSLSLPVDKMEKMMTSLRKTVRKKKITRKELEKLAGYLAHASKVVRGGGGSSRDGYTTH